MADDIPNDYSNVIQFTGQRSAIPNYQCGCGSEWFNASIVLTGREVTGYLLPLTCAECGKEHTP